MANTIIDIKFGREAYGINPAGYHAWRPAYPAWMYEMIRSRCSVGTNTDVLEIGAGTGIATQQVLTWGVRSLTAIEPDARSANFLLATTQNDALTVINTSLEDADLPVAGFDVAICITAFHWLKEDEALARIARLLKPGGWWAMAWNVFGDPNLHDAFHEATKDLLTGPSSPAEDGRRVPFALDIDARMAALKRAIAFDDIEYRVESWPLVLTAEQTVNLYATFSNIIILEDRDMLLAELGRIAREEFNGSVTRNMTTIVYVARKRE